MFPAGPLLWALFAASRNKNTKRPAYEHLRLYDAIRIPALLFSCAPILSLVAFIAFELDGNRDFAHSIADAGLGTWLRLFAYWLPCAVLCYPDLLIDRVLIPRGMVVPVYVLRRLNPGFLRRARTHALVATEVASAYAASVNPGRVARRCLRDALSRTRQPDYVFAESVAAHALAELCTGDGEKAERLLDAVTLASSDSIGPLRARLARDVATVRAIDAGDLVRAIEAARSLREMEPIGVGAFVGARLREARDEEVEPRLAIDISPSRAVALPVEISTWLASVPATPAAPQTPNVDAPTIAVALGRIATFVRKSAWRRTREALIEIFTLTERTFADGEARAQVARRCVAFESRRSAEEAIDDLRTKLARALSEAIVESVLSIASLADDPRLDENQLADATFAHVRDAVHGPLTAHAKSLARRADEKIELAIVDEWAELGLLLRAHDRALRIGGEPVRRAAFEALQHPISHYAVWKFNVRHERDLAHEIFVMLLNDALALNLPASIDLYRRNAAAGR